MRRCLDCHKRVTHSHIARLCPPCALARRQASEVRRRLAQRLPSSARWESEAQVERLFALVAQAKPVVPKWGRL